jgi:hypothetical protein
MAHLFITSQSWTPIATVWPSPPNQESCSKSLLHDSIEIAKPVRARLQSCRKSIKTMLGFSLCVFCFQMFTIPQRLKSKSEMAIHGTTTA